MKAPSRVRQMPVLRVVARAMVPVILLFGLYVQFHGDFGPGGGFQAGVIFTPASSSSVLSSASTYCSRSFPSR